jgi:hypothetical protein
MASYLPPYLTRAQSSAPSQSQSESISYDYSGQDEINKRKDEASQLAGSKYQALYGGDVAGSVGAGQRIRSLLSSLKDIQPVRINSISSSSNMDGGSQAIEGHHDADSAPDSPAVPPNRMNSGLRKKVMSNVLAGQPRQMNEQRGFIA